MDPNKRLIREKRIDIIRAKKLKRANGSSSSSHQGVSNTSGNVAQTNSVRRSTRIQEKGPVIGKYPLC